MPPNALKAYNYADEDLKTIKGVEVFKIGKHTDSQGREREWTQLELDSMLKSFQNGVPSAVHVKLGHTSPEHAQRVAKDLGLPAVVLSGEGDSGRGAATLGRVSDLTQINGTLIAELSVPEAISNLITTKMFGAVSSEIIDDYQGNGPVLSGLALLGSERPALKDISGLDHVTILDDGTKPDSAYIWEFIGFNDDEEDWIKQFEAQSGFFPTPEIIKNLMASGNVSRDFGMRIISKLGVVLKGATSQIPGVVLDRGGTSRSPGDIGRKERGDIIINLNKESFAEALYNFQQESVYEVPVTEEQLDEEGRVEKRIVHVQHHKASTREEAKGVAFRVLGDFLARVGNVVATGVGTLAVIGITGAVLSRWNIGNPEVPASTKLGAVLRASARGGFSEQLCTYAELDTPSDLVSAINDVVQGLIENKISVPEAEHGLDILKVAAGAIREKLGGSPEFSMLGSVTTAIIKAREAIEQVKLKRLFDGPDFSEQLYEYNLIRAAFLTIGTFSIGKKLWNVILERVKGPDPAVDPKTLQLKTVDNRTVQVWAKDPTEVAEAVKAREELTGWKIAKAVAISGAQVTGAVAPALVAKSLGFSEALYNYHETGKKHGHKLKTAGKIVGGLFLANIAAGQVLRAGIRGTAQNRGGVRAAAAVGRGFRRANRFIRRRKRTGYLPRKQLAASFSDALYEFHDTGRLHTHKGQAAIVAAGATVAFPKQALKLAKKTGKAIWTISKDKRTRKIARAGFRFSDGLHEFHTTDDEGNRLKPHKHIKTRKELSGSARLSAIQLLGKKQRITQKFPDRSTTTITRRRRGFLKPARITATRTQVKFSDALYEFHTFDRRSGKRLKEHTHGSKKGFLAGTGAGAASTALLVGGLIPKPTLGGAVKVSKRAGGAAMSLLRKRLRRRRKFSDSLYSHYKETLNNAA